MPHTDGDRGACYGVLLSLLRSWTAEDDEQSFLEHLDEGLPPVCEALATIGATPA